MPPWVGWDWLRPVPVAVARTPRPRPTALPTGRARPGDPRAISMEQLRAIGEVPAPPAASALPARNLPLLLAQSESSTGSAVSSHRIRRPTPDEWRPFPPGVSRITWTGSRATALSDPDGGASGPPTPGRAPHPWTPALRIPETPQSPPTPRRPLPLRPAPSQAAGPDPAAENPLQPPPNPFLPPSPTFRDLLGPCPRRPRLTRHPSYTRCRVASLLRTTGPHPENPLQFPHTSHPSTPQ